VKTFFILSLPRSRTAWLANFLTYENSFCFHEGLLQVNSPDGLKALFESTDKKIVGNSDCGNIFFLEEIKELYPEAVFIHIKRDVHHVIESLKNMDDDFKDFQSVYMADNLLSDISRSDCHAYFYDELDEHACREIWNVCIGTPFDRKRWEMLDGIDMTVIEEKKMNQILQFKQNVLNHRKGFH
jgi:hypothetical protein